MRITISRRALLAAPVALLLPSCRRKRFGHMTGFEGKIAPFPPVQKVLDRPQIVMKGEIELALFASFSVEAMVLSSKRYRDPQSEVMPLDLALGWGEMSDPSVAENVDVWQGGRWYHWRYGEAGATPRDVSGQSSNMHMAPAGPYQEGILKSLRPGNGVLIEGFLCDVTLADGTVIDSSRGRGDTGAGACEIVYAETVKVLV